MPEIVESIYLTAGDSFSVDLKGNYSELIEAAIRQPELLAELKKDINAALTRLIKSEDIYANGRNMMIALPPEMVEELIDREKETGITINQHVIAGLRATFSLPGTGEFISPKSLKESADELLSTLNAQPTAPKHMPDDEDELVEGVTLG